MDCFDDALFLIEQGMSRNENAPLNQTYMLAAHIRTRQRGDASTDSAVPQNEAAAHSCWRPQAEPETLMIDGIGRLAQLIQQRTLAGGRTGKTGLAGRTSNAGNPTRTAGAGLHGVADAGIGAGERRPLERERKAFRWLRGGPAVRTGRGLINDPKFHQLVDIVQQRMQAQPDLLAASQKAARLLLAMPRKPSRAGAGARRCSTSSQPNGRPGLARRAARVGQTLERFGTLQRAARPPRITDRQRGRVRRSASSMVIGLFRPARQRMRDGDAAMAFAKVAVQRQRVLERGRRSGRVAPQQLRPAQSVPTADMRGHERQAR